MWCSRQAFPRNPCDVQLYFNLRWGLSLRTYIEIKCTSGVQNSPSENHDKFPTLISNNHLVLIILIGCKTGIPIFNNKKDQIVIFNLFISEIHNLRKLVFLYCPFYNISIALSHFYRYLRLLCGWTYTSSCKRISEKKRIK